MGPNNFWAFLLVKFGVSLSNCGGEAGSSPFGQVMLLNPAWSKRWTSLERNTRIWLRIELIRKNVYGEQNIIVGLGQAEEARLSAREAGTLS